eukprot:1006196-Pyramimonas_sp.AAC.1
MVDRFAPHPSNRNTQGLDPLNVQTLLSKMLRDGFSHALTTDATAFEVSPNRDTFSKQMEFQSILESNSN